MLLWGQMVLAKVLFQASVPIAILAGAVVAIIVWLVAHFANKGRTAV